MLESNEMNESFVRFAMKLFADAGHVDAPMPVFINHSPEQVVFFDNNVSISLSIAERQSLKCFRDVSHLFTINGECFKKYSRDHIAFYSMELICNKATRSQISCDIHKLLHSIAKIDATVLLIKCDDAFMLSMMGYKRGIVLSDWYLIEDDYEWVIEKLHIANVSLISARDYFLDLIYNVAREYYIYPISNEMATYSLFISDEYDGYIEQYEFNNFVRNVSDFYVLKYGDDYVDQSKYTFDHGHDLRISDELDLMLLDMVDDEDNYMNEELKNDSAEAEHVESPEPDEYEFETVNPAIFEDPTLMVKWIERNGKEK